MNGKMKYMHFRKEGSTGVCDKTGVHTTKKPKQVTSQFCKAVMKKGNS